MSTFSERFGFEPRDAEISTRDAPAELRSSVVDIAYEAGLSPRPLRTLICRVLFEAPDPSNWSEYPNIDEEVRRTLSDAPWYEVYNVIEAVSNELPATAMFPPLFPGGEPRCSGYVHFEERINRLFRKKGIGWQLINRRLEYRGTEGVEMALHGVYELVRDTGRATAATELHQAITDLGRRPEPDVTGAIQHAMAALECAARAHACSSDTLGQLIQRNPQMFPPPLDSVVSKAWGYTSNFGRHLVEGRPPNFDEAELMTGLSAVLCRYLARKKS
ncbi:MAG: hypothetical protein RSP_15540 [Rhodanobacter sp.]